jgi:hypothetical protein
LNDDSKRLFEATVLYAKSTFPNLDIKVLGIKDRESIASLLPSYSFFIHAFRGSLDKVLIEATLVGIPVVSINKGFQDEYGTWSMKRTDSLIEELSAFLGTPREEILKKNEERYQESLNNHTIEGWIRRLNSAICGGE